MARNIPGFRTRSPDRDRETDRRRRSAVSASIKAAIEDAQVEMQGLERRRAEAQLATVNLMENSGEFGERSRADEVAIVERERETARAAARLATLRAQIEVFNEMLTLAGDTT